MSIKRVVLLSILFLPNIYLSAQNKVTFPTTDKLVVTADDYVANDTLPYMILCHDEKSSRGEYTESVKKFMKLGYNCLAIDLRNGGTNNGVANETSTLAEKEKIPAAYTDVEKDIEAAIDYAYNKNHKKVALVGSGYSASLVLYLGSQNSKVLTVLAFSPADYFKGKLKTKDAFEKYDKQIFVASSLSESQAVKKYIASIPSDKLVQFIPPTEGAHGSAALLKSDVNYHEYWIAILMFLRQFHVY